MSAPVPERSEVPHLTKRGPIGNPPKAAVVDGAARGRRARASCGPHVPPESYFAHLTMRTRSPAALASARCPAQAHPPTCAGGGSRPRMAVAEGGQPRIDPWRCTKGPHLEVHEAAGARGHML